MLKDILSAVAEQTGLTSDGTSVFGIYNGYGTVIKPVEERNCFIAEFWVRKGTLTECTPDEFLAEYQRRPGKEYVKAFRTFGYTVNVVLYAAGDDAVCRARVTDFLDDMTGRFQTDYYGNACAKCGSYIGLSIYPGRNGGTQLCPDCRRKEIIGTSASFARQGTYAQPIASVDELGRNDSMEAISSGASFARQGTYAQPIVSVDELGRNDSMEAISSDTVPEGTGYATAESLSRLQPAAPSDYAFQPEAGDFRSGSEAVSVPAANEPVGARPENIPEHSNPIMGIAGALLFALIACAVWVLIGMAGRIMYLGGLLMGFCTVTGYKLLGKKFDIFGMVCCIIVILFSVLGSNIVIELIAAYSSPGFEDIAQALGYSGFMDMFFRFFEFVNRIDEMIAAYSPTAETVTGNFMRNLMIGYAFSGLGFLVVAIPQFRQRNQYV